MNNDCDRRIQRGRIRQRRLAGDFRPRQALSMSALATIVCCLCLVVSLQECVVVSGWSLSVMHGRTRTSFGKCQTVLCASETDQEEDNRLSETDARVLQSMLRDNKLDLEQESNMKKLLERGIRKDNEDEDNETDDGSESEKKDDDNTYSSKAIKTLADTKFWQAFKRNAGEVLESLAISVTNEIEKGAKVLVGLGFFAWDRAKRDVARALPTAATMPQKKVFQLGETSSYVEPKKEEEQEMTPSQRAQSIRQEFTTPADEISAVASEIGKIFQRSTAPPQVDKSKDIRNPFFAAFAEEREYQKALSASGENTPFYASSATLSTTATRGSARLDKAFERTSKTKLAREKENLAVKGNRLASAAIDSAYQVKTEITSEENVPGYKTKQLRESTVDVSRRIAGAAQKTAGLLGGASSFLLGGGNKENANKAQQLPPSVEGGKIKADPVDFLDDAAYFAFQREENAVVPPLDSPTEDLSGGIIIEDNKVIDESEGAGGAFGFLGAISNRVAPGSSSLEASKVSQQPPPQQKPPEMEMITDAEVTDAEVVMGNKDNFNYFDASDVVESGDGSRPYFATGDYLNNMEPAATIDSPPPSSASASAQVVTNEVDDDGLRQVAVEVISDDDFDESVFEQAKGVENLSAEEVLRAQAAVEAAEEDSEPNFVTKATLRTLDVAFLVVEKGVSVAPMALEVAQRAVSRVNDATIKDSAGSQVGWEAHNGNIRGEQRY